MTKKAKLVAERRYVAKPAPSNPPKRRGVFGIILTPFRLLLGLVWRISWAIGWRVGLIAAVIIGLSTWYFYTQLPQATALLDARARGSVTFLDHQDKVYAWRGETFGGQIAASHVALHLRNAVIAAEDKRFYGHFGISPRGILGAIRINLTEGRGALDGHGGSTITQQVAKLLCLGTAYDPKAWPSEAAYEQDCRAGGLWRKIKEVPFSFALEAKYTKDEILTIYLNRAYLGAGSRGFEAAAQRYFGKSANQVNPAEAAMLAGLLTAPSRFSPTNNLERAQNRAAVVVRLMEEQGYLTKVEADEARANPAQLSAAAEANAGGAFADWVMESAPSFLSSRTTEDVIVRTTLDPVLQAATEKAMRSIFDGKVRKESKAQAAAIVMAADGAVLAMVGGREPGLVGSFNRATQARRQTGSAFKPFVYAAAFDLGHAPNDIIDDSPLTITISGSGPWSPKNYDDKFDGPITLTEALVESRNIPAVRLSEQIGRDAVRTVANGFGISAQLADGPALALGASEATLLEMTGAYAGILNGGLAVVPYGLRDLRLTGESEPLIGVAGGLGERVISENAAQSLTYVMWQVVENGTGVRARIPGMQIAGKTGTTQAARDAWFIGFTSDYVVGVWMGYDDNTPLQGVTGGGLPAEIWHEITAQLYAGRPPPAPLAMQIPQALPQDQDINPIERLLRGIFSE